MGPQPGRPEAEAEGEAEAALASMAQLFGGCFRQEGCQRRSTSHSAMGNTCVQSLSYGEHMWQGVQRMALRQRHAHHMPTEKRAQADGALRAR